MKRKLLRRRFVETTTRLLFEEGVQAITTRRIAKEMNCNSANTYYYFKDLDELIAYAAMESFTNYLNNVSVCCADAENSLDAYRKSWGCMIESSISMPSLYEKLMYGRYSDDLGRICSGYFRLFPEKMSSLEKSIVISITDERVGVREKRLVVGNCVEEGWFTKEDAGILSEMLMWLHRGLLQELIDGRITAEELKRKFFCYMERVIQAFKQK